MGPNTVREKKLNQRHAIRLATLASASLAGCVAIYRTPGAESVPLEKLAMLEYHGGAVSGYSISQVDGRRRGVGVFERFELTPGEHSVTVEVVTPFTYSKPIILKFNAVEQRTYELKHDLSSTGRTMSVWTTWIVDKGTGQRVSTREQNPG